MVLGVLMKILTLLAAASGSLDHGLLRDADRIVTSQATGVLKIVGTWEENMPNWPRHLARALAVVTAVRRYRRLLLAPRPSSNGRTCMK